MHRLHLRYKNQTPRERTWTIHLISLEKVLKATLMIFVGYKLLTLLGRDVHEWAADFVSRHGVDTANRYVQPMLDKLVGVGDRQLKEFSVAAFGYSSILYIEGLGLWFQKRWAEYLTAIATALFIPVEIYEIFQRPTWVRFAALGINTFIVWYLTTRLRDEKVEDAHKTVVKICGITNLGDAKQAIAAGADALGFNFYRASPRYIHPDRAAAITMAIGGKTCKIGVFVNSTIDEVVDTVDRVRLDAVQLHGDETETMIDELRKRLPQNMQIIRAVRTTEDNEAVTSNADAILVDAPAGHLYGGSGEMSNWDMARTAAASGKIVYLAGGLDAQNVGDAIREVHPFAVDACSRLEKEPGLKDHGKVAAFVKAAKEAI
ncbi:MAG TPA: DUF2127 domain-containing protein [Pyrinomonadaceae bacterium]|nr:DUF2127 domain-containing protein [Pyrinomonadaceae bacterium]